MAEEHDIIETSVLDKDTVELAQKVITETDIDKTKDLVALFNLNSAKKNVLRIIKLNGLLDKVSDTMIDRFEKYPGEFSNDDLLKYMQVVQASIDRANKSLDLVDQTPAIQLQQNNQINVNINEQPQLDRDSKERISDAIKAILQRVEKEKIIQVQDIPDVDTDIPTVEE